MGYFSGGFIVQKYGSCTCCRDKRRTARCVNRKNVQEWRDRRRVDAIQLEFGPKYRKQVGADTERQMEQRLDKAAEQLAKAVKKFLKKHYNDPYTNSPFR